MEESVTVKLKSKPNFSAYKWSKWITSFEERSKEISDDKVKISTMLELAGKHIRKIYHSLKDENDTFADVVRKISFHDSQNFFHFPQIAKKPESPENNIQLGSRSRTQLIDSYSNVKNLIQKSVQQKQASSSQLNIETIQSPIDFKNPILSLSNNLDRPVVQIQLLNTTISMLIDSGATINVIDLATYDKLKPKPILEPSKTKVFT